jgi:hypothetical membrane protein
VNSQNTAVTTTEPEAGLTATRILAWAAFAGVICYVAIDVLLAFLRPEYSLLHNAESDYGRGPWFWVMDLNFLLRCALSLAIAAALSKSARQDGRSRAGRVLLVIWAVCSGLLAFFADDIEGTPIHGSGLVHITLALIAFPCAAVGTILISASLLSDDNWGVTGKLLLAVASAGAAAFLLLGAATRHPHAPGGLYERIFLGLELLWIAIAAWHITSNQAVRHPDRRSRGWSPVAGDGSVPG